MADFLVAFTRREPIEGGYTNKPEDNGNWIGSRQKQLPKPFNQMTVDDFNKIGLVGTNRGITADDYTIYLGRIPTVQDMKAMPRQAAMAIFIKNYWNHLRGNEITNQGIANDIYDACVNEGLVTGIRQTQEAVCINITGIMDDNTLDHLNNKV